MNEMNAASAAEEKEILLSLMRLDNATQMGVHSLQTARAALLRSVRELDRYIERINEVPGASERADVLNWAINELATGVMGNLRIDMIARAQADLRAIDGQRPF